jgi:DNA-directed RNA polymerase subunit H (RpoH/RPB5)
MSDTFEIIDNVYRSRITLLDILEERGYDVTRFRKFSPAEIVAAATTAHFEGLSFKTTKRDDSSQVLEVRYTSYPKTQLLSTIRESVDAEDPSKYELIVFMQGPVVEQHNEAAVRLYMTDKLRVSFFSFFQLVNNPMRHVLVPKHVIVPSEQHAELMEHYHMTSVSKFPMIRYHFDPIVRILGAVPGDILKITRPSPTSGTYDIYRVVVP